MKPIPPNSMHPSTGKLLETNLGLAATRLASGLSLALCAGPMPAFSEQAICANGQASIVNGVIICTIKETAPVTCGNTSPETVFVYFSDPSIIAASVLAAGLPNCTKITNFTNTSAMGGNGDPKFININGPIEGRLQLRRQITALDLPRERINMDMWAIQISSADSAKLADVMSEVQQQIDATSDAMRYTYNFLSRHSQETKLDPRFQGFFRDAGFKSFFPEPIALSTDPNCVKDAYKGEGCRVDPRSTLNLSEMLVNLHFANDPIKNYNKVAQDMCNFFVRAPGFNLFNNYEGKALKTHDVKRIFTGDPPRAFRRPFQNFMTVALFQDFEDGKGTPQCGDGKLIDNPSDAKGKERLNRFYKSSLQRKLAIVEFAKLYSDFQRDPSTFNPQRLQQASASLDSWIFPIVDAISRDINDYFIQPTLTRIKQVVNRNRNVDYAEVGRTTVAGLNGLEVIASSTTTTSVDEPTPLRLNQLLEDAAKTNDNIQKLQPQLANIPLGASPGALSAGSALSLAAALSKEEQRWRVMDSGLVLKITPTVFRDRTAAELKVDLQTGNPAEEQQGGQISQGNPLRPLSRISKSTLKTKVYVKAMDLFALSSFNNQTTVSGRRWYVPVLGTMWEGAFGDIPVVGGLFSFKRPTANVQHQSVILTNTLIVPSAMGMASFYCDPSKIACD